jgi:hypothetical protein
MSYLERASHYCAFAIVVVAVCVWKLAGTLLAVAAGSVLLFAVLRFRLQHRLADLIRSKKGDRADSNSESSPSEHASEKDRGK